MDTLFTEHLKIMEAISEVAIVAFTDKKGRILFANKLFCEISGYSMEELLNQDHRMLNSKYHDKEFFRSMYSTINSGKVWRGEIQNKRKDGTYYWVDTQIIPILNEDNIIVNFASVRFDITERKNMENAIIQLEKMASLGEMAAIVAHEISNPLAIIQLSVDSLKRELKKDGINEDLIVQRTGKIYKSLDRITKMIRGLRTFSRNSDSEELSLVNLKIFVEEVLSFLKFKCMSAGVIFKVDDLPDVEIQCRPDQLSQVIINLLNNAHDAVLNLDEKWIHFQVEVDFKENEITFLVRDSGPGIPIQIAQNILNPFYTTKESGKGTGLGLSIAKAIIEEHDGILYLDPRDSNTLFVFKIPIKHHEKKSNAS